MGDAAHTRVLAIMGSGETSPTMVTIHKALVAKLGTGDHSAILLDTPYAFQENASEISARARSYFARSVGLKVQVASDAAPARLAAIRSADWVFCGPGSPSYALSRWRGGPVADALRDRIAAGTGITVIASAAGLKVAVIPHYDNAEGGTHDTRFCYLGERRLTVLERDLPEDAAVLGVDEHTALIFDLATQEAEVVGRGGATVRKAGVSTVLPSGSRVSVADLGVMVRSGAPVPGAGTDGQDGSGQGSRGESDLDRPPPLEDHRSLNEVTADSQTRFEAAARDRDSATMVSAILDLEAAIQAWATDTDENDDSDRARAVLRGLVTRLGRTAEQGIADPADRLRPAVEPLIALRDALRKDRSYAAADAIRDALTAARVELRDSPDGTRWDGSAAH